MRELSIDAYTSVYGGECGATGMCGSDSGGYGEGVSAINAIACTEAGLAWGSYGAMFGGFFGRAASAIGFAVGSNAAIAFSDACNNGTY